MSPPTAGIIGAGIAGLSAAISLRRAGWQCEVFEQSVFKNEIGAAISVTPNATQCLAHWRFDFEKARPVRNMQVRLLVDKEGELREIFRSEYPDLENEWGYEAWSFHRVDLHGGLRELGTKEGEGEGRPATLRLGCRVQNADFEAGAITLANGEIVKRDLIIIADGAHSTTINQLTSNTSPLTPTGRSIYPCLIPTSSLLSSTCVAALYSSQNPGFLAMLDPIDDVLFMTYPCRGSEVMNVAVVHNTRHQHSNHTHDQQGANTSWNEPVPWSEIMQTCRNFHPTAKKILAIAEAVEADVKVHHLMKRQPFSSFIRGKALVLGDAAHVMMPTHAAGAAVSIDSAASLEPLFSNISTPIDEALIRRRLQLFDKLRVGRCNMAMILSNAGIGGTGPPDVEDEVRRFYDGPLPPQGSMPWIEESRAIFFGYDVFQEAGMVLERDGRVGGI